MDRLSRAESQERNRARLLDAAAELFRQDGYMATGVDRIAAAAGFSKGAVYSNFASKEAILLAVIERFGDEGLDRVTAAIEDAPDAGAIVRLLAEWADRCSRSGNWSLVILEHARLAGAGSASLERQAAIIRGHWRRLGGCVRDNLPGMDASDPETLGALLHEIAFAPALSFMGTPTPGDLMRLALRGVMAASPVAAAARR